MKERTLVAWTEKSADVHPGVDAERFDRNSPAFPIDGR